MGREYVALGQQLTGIMKKTRLMKTLPGEYLSCITMANLKAQMRVQMLAAANGFVTVIGATSRTVPPVMPDLMAVECTCKELMFKMKNKYQQLGISKPAVYKKQALVNLSSNSDDKKQVSLQGQVQPLP